MWLARVTLGAEAKAPWPRLVPISIRRATLGASPAATASWSTLGLHPSNRNPTTWRGRAVPRVEQVGADLAVLAAQQGVGAAPAVEADALGVRGHAHEGGDGGGDVDQLGRVGHDAPAGHAPAGQDERGPGLDHAHASRARPARPPWSSQLWAAVCWQMTSGAAGASNTWATIS